MNLISKIVGFTLISFLFCLASSNKALHPKLDGHLNRELSEGTNSIFNVFIFPHVKPDHLQSPEYLLRIKQLQLSLASKTLARPERRQLTYQLRSMIAENSQAQLLEYLKELEHSIPFKRTFWINNSLYVRGLNREVIVALANLDIVREIRGEYVIAKVQPIQIEDKKPVESNNNNVKALEWNILKIRADQAWNITRGEGVVVANIDTGVRETHEALLKTYRGYRGNGVPSVHDFNWYDPKEFANDPWWCDFGCSPKECCMDTPFDNNGHGTHTMGTIAGDETFGIGLLLVLNGLLLKVAEMVLV